MFYYFIVFLSSGRPVSDRKPLLFLYLYLYLMLQKILKSDNTCSSYSRKYRRCFPETRCRAL